MFDVCTILDHGSKMFSVSALMKEITFDLVQDKKGEDFIQFLIDRIIDGKDKLCQSLRR